MKYDINMQYGIICNLYAELNICTNSSYFIGDHRSHVSCLVAFFKNFEKCFTVVEKNINTSHDMFFICKELLRYKNL
jgi:hypothetical protein